MCETLRHWSLDSKYDVTAYLRVISPETELQIGSFSVLPFEVPHDASYNVGFSISGDPGTFSLITDIGQVTARIRKAVKESNYLIFESNYDTRMLLSGNYPLQLKERIKGGAGHLSNAETGEVICEEYHDGLRFVGLCHLSGNNNSPEVALSNFMSTLKEHGIEAVDGEKEEEYGSFLPVTTIRRNTVSPLFRFG